MRKYNIGEKINYPTWERRPSTPYWTQTVAGVIPYQVVDDRVYFLFAFNLEEKLYIDFSSHVKTVDRNPEGTLMRAVNTISRGLIQVSEETLSKSSTLYLHDHHTLITFVKLPNDLDRDKLLDMFLSELANDGQEIRNSHLRWFSDIELISIITNEQPVIRRQVRCLIRDISKIVPILKHDFDK